MKFHQTPGIPPMKFHQIPPKNPTGCDLPMQQSRKPLRLEKFDYGAYGYYFVTLHTATGTPPLSRIVCREVGERGEEQGFSSLPTPLGEKVLASWYRMESLHETVRIDHFVLMPNHLHSILLIKNLDAPPMKEKRYSFEIAESPNRPSLQGLMKDFKSVTTRQYMKLFGAKTSLWNRSFYDTVIHSNERYYYAWRYIEANPRRWFESHNVAE